MSTQMTARERNLAIAVGAIVFLIVNFIVFKKVQRSRADFAVSIAAKTAEIDSLRQVAAERDMWAARDGALRAKQPRLEDSKIAGASVALIEVAKKIAGEHQVVIENQVAGAVKTQPLWQSATATFDTKCEWEKMVKFVAALQTPDRFLVIETLNLQVDPAENSKMRGKFSIAQWYAPKGAN